MNSPLTPDKFLSDEEFQALSQNLDRWFTGDPRNSLIFQLLLHTGARPSEILKLRAKDLIQDYRGVYLIGLKGSNSRVIPLPDPLWEKLHKFVGATTFTPEDQIFPIAYNTLGQIWRNWRPCKKTLRSTRHTFAVRMYKKTRDLRLVQKMLGHKWLSTTEIYLDFVYSQEEFRKAIIGL